MAAAAERQMGFSPLWIADVEDSRTLIRCHHVLGKLWLPYDTRKTRAAQ